MRDRVGEVWEAQGIVFAVLASDFENRMHRLLVLDAPRPRFRYDDLVNMGDWPDGHPLWIRIA